MVSLDKQPYQYTSEGCHPRVKHYAVVGWQGTDNSRSGKHKIHIEDIGTYHVAESNIAVVLGGRYYGRG
jgi:hypothetical protein